MSRCGSTGFTVCALLLALGYSTISFAADKPSKPVQGHNNGAAGAASEAGERDVTHARENEATGEADKTEEKGSKAVGPIFFDLKEQDPDGFLSPPD